MKSGSNRPLDFQKIIHVYNFLYIITLQCPLAPPGAPGTDTQTSWTTFSEIINLAVEISRTVFINIRDLVDRNSDISTVKEQLNLINLENCMVQYFLWKYYFKQNLIVISKELW